MLSDPYYGWPSTLSQVFGFAKQSGGEIIAESEPAGACILVVEDNAEVGRFATEVLAELGYLSSVSIERTVKVAAHLRSRIRRSDRSLAERTPTAPVRRARSDTALI